MNEEARAKMSASKFGPKNPRWGKHCSSITRLKMRMANLGDRGPSWKGGIRDMGNGYFQKYIPLHPHANKKGYIPLHRFILEEKLGRHLSPEEVAHHIDLDRANNDPSNLVAMQRGEHVQYHFRMKYLFEHLVGA